jgi:hypothetical protein
MQTQIPGSNNTSASLVDAPPTRGVIVALMMKPLKKSLNITLVVMMMMMPVPSTRATRPLMLAGGGVAMNRASRGGLMRGDKQWFDDVVAQAELATKFEHLMFDMGLDVREDAGFSAWFHFQQIGPMTKLYRFDQPVWMHETFKDFGGYAAYLEDCE